MDGCSDKTRERTRRSSSWCSSQELGERAAEGRRKSVYRIESCRVDFVDADLGRKTCLGSDNLISVHSTSSALVAVRSEGFKFVTTFSVDFRPTAIDCSIVQIVSDRHGWAFLMQEARVVDLTPSTTPVVRQTQDLCYTFLAHQWLLGRYRSLHAITSLTTGKVQVRGAKVGQMQDRKKIFLQWGGSCRRSCRSLAHIHGSFNDIRHRDAFLPSTQHHVLSFSY